MADINDLKNYINKLHRVVNSSDWNLFGRSIVKKSKVDDVLVCLIAILPESFKKATKRRVSIEMYPAVAAYNRLSKTIIKPFFLSRDFYIFPTSEILTLLQTLSKNIERDIKKLEEESA